MVDALPGKTRILVTHALHFLPHVDYIYTVSEGKIVEQGTYHELTSTPEGLFARFIEEFASKEHGVAGEKAVVKKGDEVIEEVKDDAKKSNATVKSSEMMQEEERNTGSVALSVYGTYLRAGRGWLFGPLFLVTLIIWQGAQVMSSYW